MLAELLIAALETTGEEGAVALLRGDALLGEEALGAGTTHGAALHPALERLLRAAGARAADLGLVVAGTGPGSYTGMRVGVGAARSLAFAAGCPVVGVPSFEALAAGAPAGAAAVACVRDARRGEVYVSVHGPAGADGARPAILAPCRRTLEAAAAACPAGTLVLGEHRAALADAARAAAAGSAADSVVRAAVLGRLGAARFRRDGAPDPAAVLPLYLQDPLALRKGEGARGG